MVQDARAKMFQTLKLEFDDDVANLILNRPERLNAINHTMIAEIGVALDVALQKGARALVIRGEGRAFSSGGDLLSEGIAAIDLGEPLERLYNPVVEKLFNYPIPIVAAVRGPAAGAACGLALAADLVIAEKSAYFVLSFIHVGLVPDCGATWLLTRHVGRARATEMMMLGERLAAPKALEWGLIHRVVEDGHAAVEAQQLARKLAKGPTAGYGHLRKCIRAALDGDLSASLMAERDCQRLAGQTHDFRESIQAFKDKRPAVHTGS